MCVCGGGGGGGGCGLKTFLKKDIIQVRNSSFIIECCLYCGL